jgi:hypothetical protein
MVIKVQSGVGVVGKGNLQLYLCQKGLSQS